MKCLLPTILLLLICTSTLAQKKPNYGILQKPNEEVLFGVNLKSNNKIAVVARDKKDKYIVYRFGTKDKIELQYPAILDQSAWKSFRYSGYSRLGIKNSPEEIHSISFSNNNIDYQIYDNWIGDKKQYDVGITVNMNGKKVDLKGNASTRFGTIGSLMDKGDLLHNYYWDDNQ